MSGYFDDYNNVVFASIYLGISENEDNDYLTTIR
jgi:hypothetical protein